MNNENLKLSLSAVMDNAADELELRRVLANTEDSVMATWSRYQIARSVLRKEAVFPKLDLASAVSEAIAKDDEKLSSSPAISQSIVNQASRKPTVFSHIGKFAVAASILAVTLSTAYFFNNDDTVTKQESFAQSGQTAEGVAVATNDQWIEQRLSNFVDRHEQQGVLTIDSYDQAANLTDTVTN